MKKIALAFMAAAAAVFGFGLVAHAQYSNTISVSPVTSGGPFTATYANCVVGDTITFTQPESTPTSGTAPCEPVASTLTGSIVGVLLPAQAGLGTATFEFSAGPTGSGPFTVTAAGELSPEVTFQFTVGDDADQPTDNGAGGADDAGGAGDAGVTGGLPATGNSGLGTTAAIAIGLLTVGLGLFGVAHVRRRQTRLA